MKSWQFNIAVYTKEQQILSTLDLEIPDNNFEWEKRTFWRIDWAFPSDLNKDWTEFVVNGDVFITDIEYKDFVKLVNENL